LVKKREKKSGRGRKKKQRGEKKAFNCSSGTPGEKNKKEKRENQEGSEYRRKGNDENSIHVEKKILEKLRVGC